MHALLSQTNHRPFPLPAGGWRYRQRWCDLLFAHWPIAASILRPFVPAELEIDEFDGTSWIGLVPFRMEGITHRLLPELPWVSAFAEMNVRIYVRHKGVPGVWFFSLDAANQLAVWAARRYFHLPYYFAEMSVQPTADGGVAYRSKRKGVGPAAEFDGEYRPVSDVFHAKRDSLDAFLVERYCLFTKSPTGGLLRGDIQHAPWPIQRAEANIVTNTACAAAGIELPSTPPVLHFSRRIDVILWPFVGVR